VAEDPRVRLDFTFVMALVLAPLGHVTSLAFLIFKSLRFLDFSSFFFSFRFLYLGLPILLVSPYLLACPSTLY
jgi:hypothetical protein